MNKPEDTTGTDPNRGRPPYQKPEGATAEDPEGRRFAKNKRKEAFLDRLYGTPART